MVFAYLRLIFGVRSFVCFIANPTAQACQEEAPGKCHLSGKQGPAINCCCHGALWDGAPVRCSKEEERGPMVAVKTCKSHARNVKRIEFPWQLELLMIASQRQKPSAKFDISILKY